jgi:hypothetical protein
MEENKPDVSIKIGLYLKPGSLVRKPRSPAYHRLVSEPYSSKQYTLYVHSSLGCGLPIAATRK